MTFILQEPWDSGLSIQFRVHEVIARVASPYQEMLIARTETYGLALFLDDLVQSTEADEALYHESFVHPAMVIHGAPRRVLVGGTGEGATLRELLRHPTVERVEAIDLDREVVAACRKHLPAWSDGAFDDPRVNLRFEDVQQTVAEPPDEPWDLVFLDITDPVEDGPAVDLFTARFFARVADQLADDGIMVLQSGDLDPYRLDPIRTVVTTLKEVFDWVVTVPMHVPSFHGIWSMTLAARSPKVAVPDDLEARVSRLPLERLTTYSAATHRAMFLPPPWLERGLAQPGRVLTGEDDERLVVYRRGEEP